MASDGQNHRDIARSLDINRQMARLWRNRWLLFSITHLNILRSSIKLRLALSILVRKLLKRASFVTQDDLKNQILHFLDYFNQTMAKSFKWAYKGKVLAIYGLLISTELY